MGKADDTYCYLCKSETETITHLYWSCFKTKRLWERLKEFLFDKTGIKLVLDPLPLLLGVSRKNPDEGPVEIINLLSLIVKSYIHGCKCKNVLPTEQGLISKIYYIKKMELAIAQKNGLSSELNHQRKWHWMEDPQT